MDATDRKILAELQVDGRLTLTDLADRVNLSISRCQRRVRELETNGAIRGYRAIIDPAAVGLGFEVLVFGTVVHPESVTEIDAALGAIPQVVEARRLFGDPDYLIRVVTSDLADYQQLYDTVLSKIPGIQRLSSTIVLKHSVPARALPTHS
jgi:DNA-binding Lrp family transcriptional regulator